MLRNTAATREYAEAAADLIGTLKRLRRALFMCAASCQGGHSKAGMAAADMLGVAFPIRMEALRVKAIQEGFDPGDLWPWWIKRTEGP